MTSFITRNRKLGSAIGLAAALLVLAGSTALAAAPTNDDFNGAVRISTSSFSDARNTLEATTAPDDPFPWCSWDLAAATVWYTFTPTADVRVTVNTSASDYTTVVSAFTGTRGALDQFACNDALLSGQSELSFRATAGTAYYLMVGAADLSTAGNLSLSVSQTPLPAPVKLTVSINRKSSFDPKTGLVTVQGTVTCSRPIDVWFYGDLRETVNRINVIHGFLGSFVSCNGTTPWTATVSSDNPGLTFTSGSASAMVFAEGWDPERLESVSAQATGSVQLSPGKRPAKR